MILTWKRIQLKKLVSNDYSFFKEFLRSDVFLQYMTYNPMLDQKQYDDFLHELFSKHDSPEFFCGPFSILLNSKPIGMTGLSYKSDSRVKYELWYFLNPVHAGKGLMQEAVECILDYIKTFRSVEKVCAYSVTQNENSSNLLYRNNFRLVETFKNGFKKNNKKYDVQYFELEL